MTKVHADVACGEPAHRKEGKEIIHQEELFHSFAWTGRGPGDCIFQGAAKP